MRVLPFSGQYGLLPNSGWRSLYGRIFMFPKMMGGIELGGIADDGLGSSPIRSVEAAVLDGFGDMFRRQMGCIFQIRNGASDFENPIVRAGAETLLRHGAFQQAFAIGREIAETPDMSRAHLGIAVKLFARGGETLKLFPARRDNALPDLGGGFRLRRGPHLLVIYRGDVNVNINTIHQRTGNF